MTQLPNDASQLPASSVPVHTRNMTHHALSDLLGACSTKLMGLFFFQVAQCLYKASVWKIWYLNQQETKWNHHNCLGQNC